MHSVDVYFFVNMPIMFHKIAKIKLSLRIEGNLILDNAKLGAGRE